MVFVPSKQHLLRIRTFFQLINYYMSFSVIVVIIIQTIQMKLHLRHHQSAVDRWMLKTLQCLRIRATATMWATFKKWPQQMPQRTAPVTADHLMQPVQLQEVVQENKTCPSTMLTDSDVFHKRLFIHRKWQIYFFDLTFSYKVPVTTKISKRNK